jgi:acetyltransferase-like isoleucine patch superfamily enzyme
VGPDVEFRRHCRIELTGEGTVTIGARSVLTWDVTLQCTQSIVLGPDCVVSQGVSIIDGQHRFRDPSRPILEQGFEWNPVAIGDGAWIGAKCTVMADVGTRAVVGANSVVTRDVPPFTMAAGAPARVIHELDTAGASPGSDA